MANKTIKAYWGEKYPYKLIRDGYKTVTGEFTLDNDTPSTVVLDTPSEEYTSNLVSTVTTDSNCPPIIDIKSVTLPDDEVVSNKIYLYAPSNKKKYNTQVNLTKAYTNFSYTDLSNIDILTGVVKPKGVGNKIIKEPFSPGNSAWEIKVKVKTGNDLSREYNIFNNPIDCYCIRLGLAGTVAERWELLVSKGSSWITTSSHYGSHQVRPNTVYWIKAGYDGTTYYLDYSFDGETYVRDVAYTSSIKVPEGREIYITDNVWTGVIYLAETSITIGEEVWWVPYTSGTFDLSLEGCLDENVTQDDYTQAQNYKVYAKKTQDDTNELVLTQNYPTETGQKYNQFVQQLNIPARSYKYYYIDFLEKDYSNVNIAGSLEYNKKTGIAGTNFGSSNYLCTTVYFNGIHNIECYIKFLIVNTDDNRVFFSNNTTNASMFRSDRLTFRTWWPSQAIGTYNHLKPNYIYWGKCSTDNTGVYTLSIMEDKGQTLEEARASEDWIVSGTTNSSNIFTHGYNELIFGRNTNSWPGQCIQGFLCMDSAAIYQNGKLLWSAAKSSEKWLASKSKYTTKTYRDQLFLNFEDSHIGVTGSGYYSYKYPVVCTRPIDETKKAIEYIPNVIFTGSIEFDKYTGLLTNFNATSFATIAENFAPGANTWEIKMKLRTLASTKEVSFFLGSINAIFGIVLGVANYKFHVWLSSTGTSWDIADAVTTDCSPNTVYWIKMTFTGSEYIFSSSTNGTDWESFTVAISTSTLFSSKLRFGAPWGREAVLSGNSYIDLKETQITIGDEVWYTGVTATEVSNRYEYPKYNNFNRVGSPVVDEFYGTATGFTNTDYLNIAPNSTNMANSEFLFMFKTSDDISGFQNIFVAYPATELYIEDEMLCVFSESTSSRLECVKVDANTSYWAKVKISNNTTSLSFSTNGVSYSDPVVITNNYTTPDRLEIGSSTVQPNRAFKGTIYLDCCSIKVNDEVWWTAANPNEHYYLPGCLNNVSEPSVSKTTYRVYYKNDYSYPVLTAEDGSYSEGTFVDKIELTKNIDFFPSTGHDVA